MLNVSSKMYIFNDEDTSLITKEATDKGILNVINDIKKAKKILMMHLHTKIQTIHPM